MGDDLIGLSSKTGAAIEQTVGISESFARAGLTGRGYGSVVELTDRALTGMQGTTLDAAQATELFIQIIQQVEGGARGLNKELVTTTKLFDVLGKAEDITASKATDVQAAFKRSAASVLATGTSIEEATTLISVLQERTQRGGDVIGTALKTMAARISSASSDATVALNSIGVATIDTNGNLRNLFDVLQDTSIAFQNLTESEQASVAVKAAGIRQVEIFRSAVRDFGRMTDVSTQLQNASGDATRKQQAEFTKLSNVLSRLQIAFQKMAKTAADNVLGKVFIFGVTAIEKAATAVAKFDKMIGGALSTALGIAGVVIGFKVLIPMLIGIGRAINFFIGSQKRVAQEMGVIQKEATAVGVTIEGQMVTSINRSAEATARLRVEMEGVASASMRASQSAQGMIPGAGAGVGAGARGPGVLGGGGPGGRGNQQGGGAIVQPGAMVLPGKQLAEEKKTRSKLGRMRDATTKQLGRFKSGMAKLVTNASALSIGISILGGAVQSAADNIRAAGNDKLGTAVDVAGGALQGAGSGALIGSLIAPGIGTAVGAVLGGITGAIPGLTRHADEAANKTRELTESMIRLGVITSENGEISSEASQKIESALRNIDSATALDLWLERQKRARSGEGEAARQDVAIAKTLEEIGKNLQANVDPSQAIEAQQQVILKELSRLIKQQTGRKTLDLSSLQFQVGGLGGEGVTDKGLTVITNGMVQLTEALGQNSDALKASLDAEVAVGQETKKSTEAVKIERKAADTRQKAFADSLKAVIASNNLLGSQGPTFGQSEEAVKLRDLIIGISKGQVKADDQRLDPLIRVVEEKGFITGTKGPLGGDLERIKGPEVAGVIAQAIKDATAIQNEQARITGADNAETLSRVLNTFSEFTRESQAVDRQQRLEATAQKREGRTQEAFGGLDVNALGDFVGDDINELQLTLRTFIQDFNREVLKLNESRIKATTPQIELATALAENAQAILQAADKTASAQTKNARLVLQQAIGKVGDRGQQTKAEAGALRRQFPILKEAGATGIEDRLKEFKGGTIKDLKTLFDTASDKDIAEILGIGGFKTEQELRGAGPDVAQTQAFIQKEISEIKAFAQQTMGQISDQFVNQALAVIRDAQKKGIDPTEGLKTLQERSPEFGNFSVDNQKKILAALTVFAKSSVSIEKEALDKRLKSNQLNIAAIKARISEEKRVLGVEKNRREALAMNERAMAEELTGMRRLIAERDIATKLLNAEIDAEQKRANALAGDIAALQPQTQSKDDKERVSALNEQRALQIELDNTQTGLIKKRGQLQISTARDSLKAIKLVADAGKQAADAERTRIGAMSEISSLLSVDRSAMEGFNAELRTLSANFKIAQAEVAAQAEDAGKIKDQGQREDALKAARQAGLKVAFDMARAEAQIEAKRRQAIKQTASKLLSNQQEQVAAQKKIIDATKALSDSYEAYLQAVDGAILATTKYNLEISLADVAARKTTGGFTGMRDQISAVQAAFRDAERMAAEMGASEKTLVNIRRESINQQLDLFNQLLSQQTSAARAFFTSSAEDQANLAQGIQEAKGLAELFGGSFDAFKGQATDPGALNELGSKILSLPQDMRKRIQEAIDTLKITGGTIGGFTAEELETAITSAAFGESQELQIDPLFEVQQRIADLQREQAQIATEQLIAANEQVQGAKEQLELAQDAKDLAEIQAERVKEEGAKLRAKLGELRGGLNTTLLQQIQNTTKGFQSVTSAVGSAADRMISTLPGAFSAAIGQARQDQLNLAREGGIPIPESESVPTPFSRSKDMADDRRDSGKNRANAAASANQSGPAQVVPTTPTQSNNPNDPNARTFSSMLTELQDISKNMAANLAVTQEIKDDQNNTVGTAAATVAPGGETEITVNVIGTSTVTVTGFEAGAARIATALSETFGGFATEELRL